MNQIEVGDVIEISLAYTMDGPVHDEISACVATVVELSEFRDLLVRIENRGDEWWITPSRVAKVLVEK